MTKARTCLLTIYTEAALESRLTEEFETLGIPGYTITNARGKGSRGVRSATWEADANIRIEVICEENLAHELASHLQEHYYENFAMVITIGQIEVFRPTKFTR